MGTLTVKFVLDGQTHKHEDVPPNFERVFEIARGICGTGVPNFYLSYTDSEGDNITMKDNKNLEDAISAANERGKTLKVNITIPVPATSNAGPVGDMAPFIKTIADAVKQAMEQTHALIAERDLFDSVTIRSVHSTSEASSVHSGQRSPPTPFESKALREQTITFYNLWCSKRGNRDTWTVFPMLPATDADGKALLLADGTPAPVALSEITSAHIWPSHKAPMAARIIGLLELPAMFHLDPRNFLILPTEAERVWDADRILLMPKRDAGQLSTIKVRALDRSDKPTHYDNAIKTVEGRNLTFRNNERPFMRLIGWKAVCAIRGVEEAKTLGRMLATPVIDVGEMDLDASTDDACNKALHRSMKMLDARGIVSVINLREARPKTAA